MRTTVNDLRQWFDIGVRKGATHMIIKTDWFDHEDYPVWVMPGEYPRLIAQGSDEVMECYNLRLDRESQLKEFRSNHWEPWG